MICYICFWERKFLEYHITPFDPLFVSLFVFNVIQSYTIHKYLFLFRPLTLSHTTTRILMIKFVSSPPPEGLFYYKFFSSSTLSLGNSFSRTRSFFRRVHSAFCRTRFFPDLCRHVTEQVPRSTNLPRWDSFVVLSTHTLHP